MRTNKDLLIRSLKLFGYTVVFMFTAPYAIYQAFKNQEHPLYIPVLVLGFLLAISAIGFGFYSIKTLMDAIFGKKSTKKQ
ncbi:DUF6095 family protein [Spongiimicrobium salis]|uniref:DUF6095 family protein n=1 Tax=Spongiimicrobium salis TaxID=1667022 RepID=UPI00374D829D